MAPNTSRTVLRQHMSRVTYEVSTAASDNSSSLTPLSLDKLCFDNDEEEDEAGEESDAYELEAHLDDENELVDDDDEADRVDDVQDARDAVDELESGVDMLLLSP